MSNAARRTASTGGDLNVAGMAGSRAAKNGNSASEEQSPSPMGAASMMGIGGSHSGGASSGYGAGGGGSLGYTASSGGAGTAGIVIVTEYYG